MNNSWLPSSDFDSKLQETDNKDQIDHSAELLLLLLPPPPPLPEAFIATAMETPNTLASLSAAVNSNASLPSRANARARLLKHTCEEQGEK